MVIASPSENDDLNVVSVLTVWLGKATVRQVKSHIWLKQPSPLSTWLALPYSLQLSN